MYLYEAIKLGAMLKPQGFGGGSATKNADETCAFGAARDAIGQWSKDCNIMWPVVASLTHCPDCKTKMNPKRCESGATVISVHLNDTHKWTREQIAEWLKPIEVAYYKKHPEQAPKEIEVKDHIETLCEAHI